LSGEFVLLFNVNDLPGELDIKSEDFFALPDLSTGTVADLRI
jgi:hypothetical protein